MIPSKSPLEPLVHAFLKAYRQTRDHTGRTIMQWNDDRRRGKKEEERSVVRFVIS